MNDPECLDPAALDRLRHLGNGKFFIEMIDLYLDWSARKLAQARSGEQAGDLRAIEMAAHSLKSSAANLGAVQVHDLANRLETLAHDRQMDAVVPLLRELTAASEQVATRLTALRNQPPA